MDIEIFFHIPVSCRVDLHFIKSTWSRDKK